ncbi:MAG: SRPBCC family protein [Halobacteriaceae archaeon]
MPTYERSTRVRAPLDEVWSFHSTPRGLAALTPRWMHLRVEAVRGPDGRPNPDVLDARSVLELSVRPGGVGPRQRWTSRIVAREREDGAAFFRDEMVDGPFREWVHTHRFVADGDATMVHDRVVYALPFGPVGDLLGPLAVAGFEPMFRYRHRRTQALLERA